jgi:hypothetical protein
MICRTIRVYVEPQNGWFSTQACVVAVGFMEAKFAFFVKD